MGNTKEKKRRRKKEQQRARLKKSLFTCFGCIALLAAIGVVTWIVIYHISFSVKEHKNYSTGLNADGTIIGFQTSDVTLCDLNTITASREDLTPTDSDVENYLTVILGQYGMKLEDFNDEVVKMYFPGKGDTVEKFYENYKEENFDTNLENYILGYLDDHSEIKHYPDGYLTGLKGLLKGIDMAQYESLADSEKNNYRSFNDYIGFSKKEYYASLSAKAQANATRTMVTQAVFEQEGLSVTNEDKERVLESYGVAPEYYTTLADTYGEGFLNQAAIRFAVLRYLKDKVEIKE